MKIAHSVRAMVVVVAAALIAPFLVAVSPPTSAAAADAALWNPGNIISDQNFYNGAAFTAGQIQDFLQQKEPSCAAGRTCLKDYRQDTPTMAADAYCRQAYAGGSAEAASTIIAKVGAACNISQKVLLVLLEKEQSLVSSSGPSSNAYGAATGFGCPDTAGCDPSFGGYFYQVYYAARQFQRYVALSSYFNYHPGRVNKILYSTNASCGTGDVYIENNATAGLYDYTPYQPNASALANMYGKGDSCAQYGNRNFWRIYSDWFGNPTTASSLMRSPDNGTVYLVSSTTKYPIASAAILASLAPLGVIGYVSQAYLDGLSTGHVVGRSLRAPDGTIYFYDAGIKLPFASCQQAADYGASCDATGYVQLTEAQIAAFVTGPGLTPVLGTTSGARYFISNGTRAEIMSDAAQTAAGIPGGMNVLTDNAVADLRLVPPIISDAAYVLSRDGGYALLLSGKRHLIASGDESAFGVSSRTAGTLSQASLDLLPIGSSRFDGAVTVGGGSTDFVLAADGRYDVTAGGFTLTPTVVPQSFLDQYSNAGTISAGSFIKSPVKADVYVTMPHDTRPISGWGALLALTPSGSDPRITVVPQALIDEATLGPVALTAGGLVRAPDDATVYLINGTTDRIALSSFIFPVEAGFTTLSFADASRIAAYPLNTHLMSFGFQCGSKRYVAAGGQLHQLSDALTADYPFDFVQIDGFTCAQAKMGDVAGSFIRTSDGSIYQLDAGTRRPVTSLARFAEISKGSPWMNVSDQFAQAIPIGAIA